jgi:O-antigen ligase
MAETGLFGLFCYLGIYFSAIRRLFRTTRKRRDFAGRMAMAALVGLVTSLFDGITDPLFHEPTVFATFWLLVAMAVAFQNFASAEDLELARREGSKEAA